MLKEWTSPPKDTAGYPKDPGHKDTPAGESLVLSYPQLLVQGRSTAGFEEAPSFILGKTLWLEGEDQRGVYVVMQP